MAKRGRDEIYVVVILLNITRREGIPHDGPAIQISIENLNPTENVATHGFVK